MSELKNIFGVNDTDGALKGKSSGGKFGLNQGTISKFEFIDTAGKDNGPGNAVDIWVKINERDYRRRLYETTGALFGPKNTKVEPGEDTYQDLFYADMGQKIAVIKHALKAVGITQANIDKISATLDPTKIGEGLKALVELVPAQYQNATVDCFLEYQWEIAEDQDKTFPELPKNMKGGYFLIPAIKPVGTWKEVRDEKGLHYIDDAGNTHLFERDTAYMESNKGTQQGAGSPSAGIVLSNTFSTNDAKKTTW